MEPIGTADDDSGLGIALRLNRAFALSPRDHEITGRMHSRPGPSALTTLPRRPYDENSLGFRFGAGLNLICA